MKPNFQIHKENVTKKRKISQSDTLETPEEHAEPENNISDLGKYLKI